jgi:hypothetical protein
LDFAVQLDGSRAHDIDADQLQEAVASAFARWQNVNCPEGGSPSFIARFSGFVSCDQHQTVCDYAPANVSTIIAHDDGWPHGGNQLGVTTPAAVIDTGELVDADLEIDTSRGDYSAVAGSPGAEALANVLTHEVGHFLGIAHSDRNDALMYFAYQSTRSIDELLSEDDIAAICAVFPPSDDELACEPSSGPAYDECVMSETTSSSMMMSMADDECIAVPRNDDAGSTDGGCAIRQSGERGEPTARWLALGAAFVLLRCRRRRLGS